VKSISSLFRSSSIFHICRLRL